MRSLFYLVLLGMVLATIAIVVRSGMWARKDPGVPINSAMRHALQGPEDSAATSDVIESQFGPVQKTASGLMYLVRRPGDGPTPAPGAQVRVHYEGRLLDGTRFDSSYERGAPHEFRVGTGQVIKGWDEALLAMRRGEKRTLIIPHGLAYGENAQGRIPARSTLVFEVELVDIR